MMIIDKPSQFIEYGYEAYELLRYIERNNPNLFYGGPDPKNWAAAGYYVSQWINLEGTTQRDVATEFDCSAMTVNRLANQLFGCDEVGEYYGKELVITGSLGALLGDRRLPVRAVGLATGEADNGVRKRLRSLDRHDEKRVLNEENRGGVDYFWTTLRD